MISRIQFYPSAELANILGTEASKSGVSVSQYVTDLLENYYGLSKTIHSITKLTSMVLKEVEAYVNANAIGNKIEFDLFSVSETYRQIEMTCGKKPSTVRASIGRSFASRIGQPPFACVRKCIINDKQKLSANNALVYETF